MTRYALMMLALLVSVVSAETANTETTPATEEATATEEVEKEELDKGRYRLYPPSHPQILHKMACFLFKCESGIKPRSHICVQKN